MGRKDNPELVNRAVEEIADDLAWTGASGAQGLIDQAAKKYGIPAALHPAATDTAHTCHFRIVLPADTATVLAYMAHHNTAEQMRANIWRAVLIRIVTALVESRCQITPVDVTTLAETPVGQTFKTAFIPEVCDIHFASAADAATAKLFFADKVVGGP